MQEIVAKEEKKERAILIGLCCTGIADFDNSDEDTMAELRELLTTAGGETVLMAMQNRHTPDPRTFIGEGKVQELKELIPANEIDLVIMFTDPNNLDPWEDQQIVQTIHLCDTHNVPVATNLASAEMLIMGLQRGDLDWREMLRRKRTVR